MSVFAILAMLFSFANVSSAAACGSSGTPTVSTDQADYGAYDTALISGSGFGCGEVLSVKVTAPDGSVLAGDGMGSPGPDVVTTDSNGEFTLSYALSGTIPGGPTSDADGAYSGQSGTYTIEVASADGTLLATVTFTDQSQLANPVPSSMIVTLNGLSWVYVSPCALNGCTTGILIGKDGFNFATQAQWALRPPPSAFNSKCASPWFDLTWNHCDFGDLNAGFVGSAPRGGLPAGNSGSVPMVSFWETLLVRVSNAPPTANAGGPYSGNEGSAIAMSGASASDPNAGAGDTLSYLWSVNSPLCSFSNANILNPNLTCSDNGSFTVTLSVNDGVNPAVTSNASVTVSNIAPSASLVNNGPISEGSSAAVSFSGVSEPSSVDSGSLHYAFDCNGGSLAASTYTGSGTANLTSCSFADNGSYTVSGKIMDKDGGSNEYTTAVTVNNVAPTIAISGASNVNEGSSYSLTLGAITDPGTDTVTTYLVDWGDGNSDSLLTHTYADGPNNYNIKIDLTDEDGTFTNAANALSVTVDNVKPTIAISGASNVNEGSSYSLTLGAITDPGTDTVSAYLVHWGDGNSDGLQTHTYTDGPNNYNITVDLTDEDGTSLNRANALSATVDNVAPTITGISVNMLQTLTGTQVTFTGSATDPSGPDTTAGFKWQWSVDAGAYTAFGASGANTFSTSFLSCGTHTVTAQAKDKNDGVSAPFSSGSVSAFEAHFLAPLNEGMNNLVQKGKVIPVKISIGCNGVPLTGLAPAIQLLTGDQTTGNETVADEVETLSSSAADTTGIMRTADSMYIYNLQVPSTASIGALYTIRVRPFGTGADMRIILKIRK